MIKFFRNIRQKLVIEANTSNPVFAAVGDLKYDIGEVARGVIGILIIIQMNKWNEERVEQFKINML